MTVANLPLDLDRYEQDEDGLPREIVGPWVLDKHSRLEKYVDISRGARKKFLGPGKGGATFIDLYSGPGRARIRDGEKVINGSSLAAWNKSVSGGAPFTQVHVADAHPLLAGAAETRLRKAAAPVFQEIGLAIDTIDLVLPKLDPRGLHVALLDPYNLDALSFDVIRKLAGMDRMDILIHVSIQDLQRNLRRYIQSEASPIDSFAPGWRKTVDTNMSDAIVRGKILEHWRSLLRSVGMTTTESAEFVLGTKEQRLYLLAFAARHKLALEFWEKIRSIDVDPQGSLL